MHSSQNLLHRILFHTFADIVELYFAPSKIFLLSWKWLEICNLSLWDSRSDKRKEAPEILQPVYLQLLFTQATELLPQSSKGKDKKLWIKCKIEVLMKITLLSITNTKISLSQLSRPSSCFHKLSACHKETRGWNAPATAQESRLTEVLPSVPPGVLEHHGLWYYRC